MDRQHNHDEEVLLRGQQRVAVRTGLTLNYMLGDHLGITNVTTDENGIQVSKLLYKPWGEVRYSSGTLPTKYTFTGQYSNAADFGLMYYNARWVDPVLGRFVQADTIIPQPGNPQSWDRYAYALNSPLMYTDPSGHWYKPGEVYLTDDGSSMYAGYYGVTISNDENWTANQIVEVVGALQDMADAFSQTIGGTPMQAIQSAFNTHDKKILLTRDPDHKVTGGAYGWAYDSYTIHFRKFYADSEINKRFICHEFGHIFDYNTFSEDGNGEARRILYRLQNKFTDFPNRELPGFTNGFAGLMDKWQFGAGSGTGEQVADMFVGYVYGKFEIQTSGVRTGEMTLSGAMRSSLMTSLVRTFVHVK